MCQDTDFRDCEQQRSCYDKGCAVRTQDTRTNGKGNGLIGWRRERERKPGTLALDRNSLLSLPTKLESNAKLGGGGGGGGFMDLAYLQHAASASSDG